MNMPLIFIAHVPAVFNRDWQVHYMGTRVNTGTRVVAVWLNNPVWRYENLLYSFQQCLLPHQQ